MYSAMATFRGIILVDRMPWKVWGMRKVCIDHILQGMAWVTVCREMQ